MKTTKLMKIMTIGTLLTAGLATADSGPWPPSNGDQYNFPAEFKLTTCTQGELLPNCESENFGLRIDIKLEANDNGSLYGMWENIVNTTAGAFKIRVSILKNDNVPAHALVKIKDAETDELLTRVDSLATALDRLKVKLPLSESKEIVLSIGESVLDLTPGVPVNK